MNVIGNICSTWVENEYIRQAFVNNKIVVFNSIGIWEMFPGGIELSPMHHTGKELNHSATRTLSRLLRHIRKDVTSALCTREKRRMVAITGPKTRGFISGNYFKFCSRATPLDHDHGDSHATLESPPEQ